MVFPRNTKLNDIKTMLNITYEIIYKNSLVQWFKFEKY
jgi:hypothetical protein